MGKGLTMQQWTHCRDAGQK